MSVASIGPDSVAQWLEQAAGDHRLHTHAPAPEAVRPRAALAAIAVAAAELERQDDVTAPPAALRALLDAELARVPRQVFGISEQNADALAWLDIAAVAELLGDHALARLLVDGVARCRRGDAALAALCAFRRGRIARRLGHLDDARWHYQDAIRLARAIDTADATDAAPLAYSGIANVYIDEGLFARAAAVLQRAVQPARGYHRLHRFNLWQGLALVHRKQGKLAHAMQASWHAYDLAVHEPGLRAEALVSLSELAVELGAAETALRGATMAIASGLSERALVAAYVVQLRALLALHDAGRSAEGRDSLRAVSRELVTRLATVTAPQELALSLLWLTEADVRTGQLDSARRRVTRALEMAAAHGFGEYTVHGERLLAEITAHVRATGHAVVVRPIPQLLDAASSRLSPLIRLHHEAHV